jgi:hypothetical protein
MSIAGFFIAAGLDGGNAKPSCEEPMSTGRAVLAVGAVFEGGARLGSCGRSEPLSDEPTSIEGFVSTAFAVAAGLA